MPICKDLQTQKSKVAELLRVNDITLELKSDKHYKDISIKQPETRQDQLHPGKNW